MPDELLSCPQLFLKLSRRASPWLWPLVSAELVRVYSVVLLIGWSSCTCSFVQRFIRRLSPFYSGVKISGILGPLPVDFVVDFSEVMLLDTRSGQSITAQRAVIFFISAC